MNTAENNKIIAEFLGQKETISEFPKFGYMTASGNWKDEFTPNELKFHKNWNWLMEVVEKIESLENNRFSVEIHKGHCNIYDMVEMEEIISIFNEDKKKSCYLGLIDFIKHYKQRKN